MAHDSLTAAFFERLAFPGDAPPADAGAALGDIVARARAAWPEVRVAEVEFLRFVADRVPRGGDPLGALGQLEIADLFLACGCARGDAGALAAFERRIVPEVRAALRSRRLSADAEEDTLQVLRERLFVAAGRQGRIAEYAGRGPLASWVRMAAVRIALNLRRGDKPEEGDEALAELVAPSAPPEFAYVKARYRDDFKAAFEAAFARLELRTRTVMRLHLLERVATPQIARVYGVDPSSVRRWIAEARTALLDGTRSALAERLKLPAAELESLMGLLVTQLDESVRRILAGGDGEAR